MWGRALAGVVPGFFLSAGLVGLVCWCLPGPWEATLVGGISAFFPLWMGVIAASFQFADARRAWTWLAPAAVASLGLLWLLQRSGVVV
jgi:hypothetical protein